MVGENSREKGRIQITKSFTSQAKYFILKIKVYGGMMHLRGGKFVNLIMQPHMYF